MEIEVYNCGCEVRIYEEFGESKNDLASFQTTVLGPSIGVLAGFRKERLVY